MKFKNRACNKKKKMGKKTTVLIYKITGSNNLMRQHVHLILVI